MNKEQKKSAVKDLLDKLSLGSTIYLADISELDAQQTSDLRRSCFKVGVQISVVKNTLLKKAMEQSDKDFGELDTVLKGNTSIMLSEVANVPAKLIKDFRKKSNKPILKGAYLDESVYIGDDTLDTLASMKSKEEVIAEIIRLLQSPARNVISSLQSGKTKLVGIVKTLSER